MEHVDVKTASIYVNTISWYYK